MPKFRKKPVVIEALQHDGSVESNRAIIDWTRGSETPATMDKNKDGGNQLSIATKEGSLWVSSGDWIIEGVQGEFYPFKPDIFEKTYEAVNIESGKAEEIPAGGFM